MCMDVLMWMDVYKINVSGCGWTQVVCVQVNVQVTRVDVCGCVWMWVDMGGCVWMCVDVCGGTGVWCQLVCGGAILGTQGNVLW